MNHVAMHDVEHAECKAIRRELSAREGLQSNSQVIKL